MSDTPQLVPEKKSDITTSTDLTIDRYIDCEDDLQRYIDDLHARQVHTVALDLEGDQGTIRYNYSVSIYQCFDGTEMVVIDALRMKNSTKICEFLTDPSITKIMFSCANDIFITQHVLNCTISPVHDIAVGQKLLNEKISLSDYLNIDQNLKNSFQRANWLKRPIAKELLNYAMNDVANLFTIEDEIKLRLSKVELLDEYYKESMKLVDRDYRIDQMHHYKAKFPGYPKLSANRRYAAAIVWVIRELIGKHFDCPVGYVLSKSAMSAIIRSPDSIVISMERELNRQRSGPKKLKMKLIETFFQKAIRFLENS
jgi:ribonuclease D